MSGHRIGDPNRRVAYIVDPAANIDLVRSQPLRHTRVGLQIFDLFQDVVLGQQPEFLRVRQIGRIPV